jgi:hypothetical protein
MPYSFLIGSKTNYSEDPSKKKPTYKESLRNKLTMDPKAMFLATPPPTFPPPPPKIKLTITVSFSNKPFDGNTLASINGLVTLSGVLPQDVGNVSVIDNPFPVINGPQFVSIGPGNNIGCFVDDSYILDGSAADRYYFDPFEISGYANITP